MIRRLLQLLSICHALRESPLARRIVSIALWLVMVIGMFKAACVMVPDEPKKPPRRPFFKRRRDHEEKPPYEKPRRKETASPCDAPTLC